MNRFAILLTICGVVISGCSEAADSTYRESGESRRVPTIHLVVDNLESFAYNDTSERGVRMQYHVQADRPMEKDTFVVVRTSRKKPLLLEDALRWDGGRGKYILQGGAVKWDERSREFLVVILAGATQSGVMEMEDSNSFWMFTVGSKEYFFLIEKYIPTVQATLPEPDERASVLPTLVEYRNAAGEEQEKHLLVEYPFNPYRVGSPRNISVKWQMNQ